MSFNDSEIEVINCLKEWNTSISKEDRAKIKNRLQNWIRKYKTEFRGIGLGINPERRNEILICAILFQGILDYLDLLETLSAYDSHKEPIGIERAWIKLCNCKDRMIYVSQYYNNKTIESVIQSIKHFGYMFEEKFGKGLFLSIEATAEKELCNICGNDTRTCPHITGKIYDGIICITIPQDLKGRAVALVENPADPRCRIWPWNTKDEGDSLVNKCTILTCFSVDDFMDDE
jgi:hypothetical protein